MHASISLCSACVCNRTVQSFDRNNLNVFTFNYFHFDCFKFCRPKFILHTFTDFVNVDHNIRDWLNPDLNHQFKLYMVEGIFCVQSVGLPVV